MMIIRTEAQEAVVRVFQETLRRIRGDRLVRETVWREGNQLFVGGADYDLSRFGRILVLGAGKASCAMAQAIEELLSDKPLSGLIVTKKDHSEPLQKLEVAEAGHPVPDEASVEAGERLLSLAQSATENDLVLVLISGGASALAEVPADGVTLQDIQLLTTSLLRAGADINELNAVRSCLSNFKAGGLARAATPATVVCLLLSDVIGNPREVIGSGPCWGAPPDGSEALHVLAKYSVPVQEHIEERLDTMPEDIEPASPHHFVVGDIYTALECAQKAAIEYGLKPKVYGRTFSGDASVVGATMAAEAMSLRETTGRFDCVIAAGETTVKVNGSGLGGRNQELACAAALALEGLKDVALLAAGTDGTDGPTDAAGGLVDGETHSRTNLRKALDQNDCYHALEAADALVVTGPTGTNLNDLVVIVRASSD